MVQAMTRRAGLVGLGLVAMAVASAVGILGALGSVVADDRAQTIRQVAANPGALTTALACVLVVIVLDLAVAVGLFLLLRSVSPVLAATAAVLRVVYATAFLAAAGQLAMARAAGAARPDDLLSGLDGFQQTWDLALLVFGLHLILIGVLVYRSDFLPRWLGVLVAIAGAGYLIDAVAIVLRLDAMPSVGTVTFVGEVALALWLLIRCRDIGRRSAVMA